jgi:hypothetical protein
MDVAIAFISSFLDPEEVAAISEWTDEHTYISEVRTVLCALPLLLSNLFIDGSVPCKKKIKLSNSFYPLHCRRGLIRQIKQLALLIETGLDSVV